MSQQSLASKTITKRNVAQSSVIFSVIVAVITLGVIATVAYVDIKEEIQSVLTEKSIPEMIAEQKVRAEKNRQQAELISQAEDSVVTMDQRMEGLKRLEQKVSEVNGQVNFVTTSYQTKEVKPQQTYHAVKAVQVTHQNKKLQNQNSNAFKQQLKSMTTQNHALKINSGQKMTAAGEAFFEVSWLFKARGNTGVREELVFSHNATQKNQWNEKTF